MLQVRSSTYRGREGFLVCGRLEGQAFSTKIFVEDRAVAEDIRDRMNAGEDPSLLDYYDEDGNLNWEAQDA